MAESLGARFRLMYGLHEPDPLSAFFLARLLDEDRRELRDEQWATSERSLAELGAPLMRSSGGGETIVLEREGALVQVSLYGGFVQARAAAADEPTVRNAIAWLRELLPAPEPVAAALTSANDAAHLNGLCTRCSWSQRLKRSQPGRTQRVPEW